VGSEAPVGLPEPAVQRVPPPDPSDWQTIGCPEAGPWPFSNDTVADCTCRSPFGEERELAPDAVALVPLGAGTLVKWEPSVGTAGTRRISSMPNTTLRLKGLTDRCGFRDDLTLIVSLRIVNMVGRRSNDMAFHQL
jgi:hypothetical protein